MSHKNCLPIVLVVLCSACGNTQYHKVQAADVQSHRDTISTFVLPTIPNILTEPEARASYLVEHYWETIEEEMQYQQSNQQSYGTELL